jgi:hypothetical protein
MGIPVGFFPAGAVFHVPFQRYEGKRQGLAGNHHPLDSDGQSPCVAHTILLTRILLSFNSWV